VTKQIHSYVLLKIMIMHGHAMANVIRKKLCEHSKWVVVSSHIFRKSFASSHFGVIPTPIIMVSIGHKTESFFLKYFGKSRAEIASMLAGYWY
jgi:integrase